MSPASEGPPDPVGGTAVVAPQAAMPVESQSRSRLVPMCGIATGASASAAVSPQP